MVLLTLYASQIVSDLLNTYKNPYNSSNAPWDQTSEELPIYWTVLKLLHDQFSENFPV